MIYKFTPQEIETLRAIGDSSDGVRLRQIFMNVKNAMSDVTNISASTDDEYAAQCIGIKRAIEFMNEIMEAMKRREINGRRSDDDFGEFD